MPELGFDFFMPMLEKVVPLFIGVVVLAIIGVLVVIGLKSDLFHKYNIPVMIFEKRANGKVVMLRDNARRKEEGGKAVYRLKKKKKEFNPPDFDDLQYFDKQNILMLYSGSSGQFIPISLEADNKLATIVNPLPEDIKLLASETYKTKLMEYQAEKSKWEQIFPIITVALLIVSAAIAILIIYRGTIANLEAVNSGLSNVAAQMGRISQELASIKATGGSVQAVSTAVPSY